MLLLVDANVLIDYASADASVLALAARHIGPIYVPRDVLDEVEQLDEAECGRLGLVVLDGTMEVAEAIGATNPWITQRVIEKFRDKVTKPRRRH